MNDTELKPCPFCGGKAKIATFDWGYSVKEYWMGCSCGCEKKKFHSKEEAVANWNTRKPMDNIVAELEKAKGGSPRTEEDWNYCGAIDEAINIVKKGGAK